MSELNPKFAAEISKYGADHFMACYNCGNCTAVCNLTEKDANFPRIFIRYGMTGQVEKITGSKEIWLCYACGDCSETCPRQAHPGEYMAALRRYSIAKAEKTGLTRMLFTNPVFSVIFTAVLAVIIGIIILSVKTDNVVSRWLFTYISYDVIHTAGIVAFVILGITAGVGLFTVLQNLLKHDTATDHKPETPFSWKRLMNSINRVATELAAMKRYRDCDTEDDSYWKKKPWLLKPWLVHWTVMWGFIGLLLATTLDFIFKDPATVMWLPSRILGTVSGILLMYGTTLAVVYRITRPTKNYEDTHLPDWMLLFFLWMAGFTGFWMELAVMLGGNNLFNQIIFLIHTVLSMELVILFAFSKFAHAIYRPAALFLYFYRRD